jgi:5-methyltetrahydropteroyltriglutamate--homocysteine methyltransferase
MQRVMEDTSYPNSIEFYLERHRADVWTLEIKDRNQKDLELFEPFKRDLKKKICVGVVSHRTLRRIGRKTWPGKSATR